MIGLDAQALTTRHAQALYPWVCQPGLPASGAVIGLDLLSGGSTFAYDVFSLYERRLVTSPNMLVLGQIGRGKSALCKSLLAREALFGRQIYVMDPKGEYGPLAAWLGIPVLRLRPGGETRLNPLDPGPLGDADAVALRQRRQEMLSALSASGLGRELLPEERAGLVAALDAAVSASARPTLGSVAALLLRPSAEMAERLVTDQASLAAAIREVALTLARMLDGDLAGMFDGETNVEIDWDGPGLVLDLSAVFGSDALAPVVVCAGNWLAQALAHPGRRRRILVADELWSTLRLVAVTRWLQSVAKLARTYGVQLLVVMHRLSDLSSQADSGTEAEKQAKGLLAECETHVIYAQPPSEAANLASLLGLGESEIELVCSLRPHRGLWRVGREVALVDHVLSVQERHLVDTDAQMREARR